MKRRYLLSYELFQPKEGLNFGRVRTHTYTHLRNVVIMDIQ
jgi:hypothetical protein